MAVYYTIKCPHCKAIVEKGKNRQSKYGSPIRNCPRCRNNYLDDNFIEPSLLSEKEIKNRTFSWGSIIFMLIGGVHIIFGIPQFTVWLILVGILFFALGLCSLIYYFKYDPNKDDEFQRELYESKQRLSDPRYVIALWELGYPIPSNIFNEAKKALNYRTKSEIYIEKMQSEDYDKTKYLCKSFKFLSDASEGKCLICRQQDYLKKYRIKNDMGTREIPICNICIERFNKHNDLK